MPYKDPAAQAAYMRRYNAAHPEARKATVAKSRAAHLDQYREYQRLYMRQWRLEHPDRNEARREKDRDYSAAYRAAHPGPKRRARKPDDPAARAAYQTQYRATRTDWAEAPMERETRDVFVGDCFR
jgi:hypothetical protein